MLSKLWSRINSIMGRKPFQWSEENENRVLAHLDFVIGKLYKESGRYGSKDDVLRNLEIELSKPGPSQGEIQKRLLKLWNDNNPNPSPWRRYEDIYQAGTNSLEDFDDDRRDTIQKEVDILRATQKLKDEGTPRKTRSGKEPFVSGSADGRVVSTTHALSKAKRKQHDDTPIEYPSKRSKKELVPSKVGQCQSSTK
jgi:hypothetical protein